MIAGAMDLELLNGLANDWSDVGGMGGPAYYNSLAGGFMGSPIQAFHQAPHQAMINNAHAQRMAQLAAHHRALGVPQGFPYGQGMGYPPGAQPMPMNFLVPQIPGVAARGGRVQFLGFSTSMFSATSGTSLTVRATPQRPIRGGRLFGSYSRVGTTATGLLTLSQLIVGTDGQLLSGDAISFDMLAPTSFGAGINLTPAVVGTIIQAQVQVSAAPASSDTIPFNLTIVGPSLG